MSTEDFWPFCSLLCWSFHGLWDWDCDSCKEVKDVPNWAYSLIPCFLPLSVECTLCKTLNRTPLTLNWEPCMIPGRDWENSTPLRRVASPALPNTSNASKSKTFETAWLHLYSITRLWLTPLFALYHFVSMTSSSNGMHLFNTVATIAGW